MTDAWTVPFQISVSIGDPQPAAGLAVISAGAAAARPAAPQKKAKVSAAEEAADAFTDKFSVASLQATSFHWRTALSLALASRLAYSSSPEVASTTRQAWGLETCEFVEADDTQCFLATSPESVLISFRGTEALGDWMANLNLLTTTRPYGKVHRGFLGAFQVVEHKLTSILEHNAGRRVLLTGHSLGGALALVAAAEWRNRFRIAWVHTFGQPAVGKKEFQISIEEGYGDAYYRFVNADDIVPMVPPLFRHAGRLYHFDDDGKLEQAYGSGELEALGVDLGAMPVDTPMLSVEQFDLMRAQLLQERATTGSADEESVESAAQLAVLQSGEESVEGLLPSVADHNMDLYVANVAHQAGF